MAGKRGAELINDDMSPLFQATVEATEEAIYNSLFAATAASSRRGTVEALPVADVLRIMRSHRAVR
jgi:D-aminopeptidase